MPAHFSKNLYLEYLNKSYNQYKNEQKGLSRHFSKEDMQRANNHMKNYWTHLSLEKCKIKPRYHNAPTRTIKIKKSDHMNS